VWLRQLQFPEENHASVFARMQAERGRMAMKYRSEGEREFTRLVAAGERQKRHILAEAYKEAERIKGEGDAGAMRIYAAAFRANPQFYKFIRTLEGYEKFLDEQTTILFPTDAEILQLLNSDAKR
jgi:membrane protease subunit HflC